MPEPVNIDNSKEKVITVLFKHSKSLLTNSNNTHYLQVLQNQSLLTNYHPVFTTVFTYSAEAITLKNQSPRIQANNTRPVYKNSQPIIHDNIKHS